MYVNLYDDRKKNTKSHGRLFVFSSGRWDWSGVGRRQGREISLFLWKLFLWERKQNLKK